MAISRLNAAIVSDKDHVAVTAGGAHFVNDAVAGRVNGVGVSCRKIYAIVTSCAVMAKAKP